MIPTQRQQSILSELHEKGAVRVSELSIQLGVSPMTVRRDIEDLAGKGLLKRVHGGAVSASTLLAEPLFSVKSRMETAVKQAIAANSIPVAQLAHSADASGSVEVIMTCGAVTRSNSLVGPIADKVIRGLRVKTLFTGAHSFSLPRGFLTPNSLEAATNSALISIADLCIALVDHTKWDSTSLSLFADFSQIDTVITDSALSGPRRKQTRSLVKHLVTV